MRPIKKGSTDQSVVIRILDSTTGAPETAVEHNTAGIALWYRREGATQTAITEAALAALVSAHSDGGIEHIGDGYYRLDLPDAAVATAANGVMVGGTVTGMIVIGCYIALVDYDPYDSVRAGLTALPNAAADAAGGLPISDAGALDIDAKLANTNEVTAARMGALTDWINGGRLDLLLDAILEDTGTTLPSTLTTISGYVDDLEGRLTAARAGYLDELAAANLPADVDTLKTYCDILNNATNGLANIKTLIDTLTAYVDTEVAAILEDTGTTLPGTLSTIAGYLDTEIAAILEDTGTTLPTTLATISGYVDDLETRLTAARAGYLDELGSTNLPADVDTLKTYCDILDNATNGLANIKTLIDTLDTVADAVKVKTDLLPSGVPKGVEWTIVFVMKLSSDHLTPATGKTVTAQVSKDGGAFNACTNAAAEISAGFYKVVLTATEMNADIVALKLTETDCDQTNIVVATST